MAEDFRLQMIDMWEVEPMTAVLDITHTAKSVKYNGLTRDTFNHMLSGLQTILCILVFIKVWYKQGVSVMPLLTEKMLVYYGGIAERQAGNP
jgi:hypothetical protein